MVLGSIKGDGKKEKSIREINGKKAENEEMGRKRLSGVAGREKWI